jgi:hypothetical protein
MHMQVEDGLSGARTNIQYRAIAVFDRTVARDAGGRQVAEPDQGRVFRGRFFQSGNMSFRNHQDVSWTLWVDVFECENMIVFMHFSGRNLAANDPAKQTISHNSSSPGDLLRTRETAEGNKSYRTPYH